jgi:hypothetical protein
MKLISYPTVILKSEYKSLTNEIISVLDSHNVALSIYQMGSVKDPGISDLDIICIFKEGVSFNSDLRANLTKHQKQILTHGIFGCNKNNINQAIDYGCFSNLNHLYGENLNFDKRDLFIDKDIKTQIAIEYLVKMFIALDAQIIFGVVKLRSFLLLAKALMFDLDLLNISHGKLFDKVSQVHEWRKNWFSNVPLESDLKKFIFNFHIDLKDELIEIFKTKEFFLPKENLILPGGLNIIKDDKFYRRHNGFLLPECFYFIGKKYINLQYRLNNLSYYIPYFIPSENTNIAERFSFYKDYINYNKKHYPFFTPLTSSLTVF